MSQSEPAAMPREEPQAGGPPPKAAATTAHRLTDIAFFAGADPAIVARSEARLRWVEFKPGALVMDFDDDSDDVFVIIRGAARVLMRTQLGHELILGDFEAGTIIGEMAAIDGYRRGANVTALVRSQVCRIPSAVFLDIALGSPPVGLRLMRMLTARVRLGNTKLLEHTILSVRLRLLSELLRLARPARGGAGLVVSPPPIQSDLAARIGARREAVSRELNDLDHQGLIRRDRGSLTMPRPELIRAEIEKLGVAAGGRAEPL
ncbi:Crp/Fnr family transcriptional regulator [Phreatobacter sp. AB_2022a]|uniref:Crp/Fnr family transcriptional regulator n=1 Tax=Phreatobacter sp. AB_2022a TaxID=3003134 RepID=UPI0022874603|nr:Crp/Fnr family transcriptional regulator [Phreatobacter sp. AB_2022a]MCZ0738693.1 Crp/Fnr family transcriptional regulator [Phreatobacter sp. AB_2022a]